MTLDELVAELSGDPEREPIASELGGASCISPWKPLNLAPLMLLVSSSIRGT